MDLAVIGAGYLGLVTAACIAKLAQNRLTLTTHPAALRGTSMVIAEGTRDAAGAWTDELVRGGVPGVAADQSGHRLIVIRSTLPPGTASRLAADLRQER